MATLLLQRHLRPDALHHLLPAQAHAGHQPLELDGFAGLDEDHPVKAGMPSALNEQRSVQETDGRPGGARLLDPALALLDDGGMEDLLQPGTGLGVREDDGAQPSAVDPLDSVTAPQAGLSGGPRS